MGFLDKYNNWHMKFFTWIVLPIFAAGGILLGAYDLVPAWQAKGGNGTPGTFTVVREECRKRNCTLYGDFVAEDGTSRTDVILYDEPDGAAEGDEVAALDSGARNGVFARSGGSSWLFFTGMTLAGLAAGVAWVFVILRAVRRRRAKVAA